MENTLKLELDKATQQVDMLWANLLREADHCAQRESRQIYRAIGDRMGDIHQTIKNASYQAELLFDSNIQCLSQILHLQSIIEDLTQQQKANAEMLQGKTEGLLYVISSQQQKINQMTNSLRLKDLWSKLLLPHKKEDDSDLHESCAVALTWLSAQCAHDILSSMPDASYWQEAFGSPNRTAYFLERPPQMGPTTETPRILTSLLKKMSLLHDLTSTESVELMHLNQSLTEQVVAGQQEIARLKGKESELLRKVGELEDSNKILAEKYRESEVAFATYRSEQAGADARYQVLEEQITLLEKENARINELFDLSMVAREEWRHMCDSIRRIESDDKTRDGSSSRQKLAPVLTNLDLEAISVPTIDNNATGVRSRNSPKVMSADSPKPPFLPTSPSASRGSRNVKASNSSVGQNQIVQLQPSSTGKSQDSMEVPRSVRSASSPRFNFGSPGSPRAGQISSPRSSPRPAQSDQRLGRDEPTLAKPSAGRSLRRGSNNTHFPEQVNDFPNSGSGAGILQSKSPHSQELWDRFITLDEVLLTDVVESMAVQRQQDV